jgi:prefoldin subunit 5
MAKEADLQADLDKIAAGVTAAQSQIADLKAQIAALGTGPVTQEQLDALTAQADAIVASLTPGA